MGYKRINVHECGIREHTRTVFSSGGNTLFLYCSSGRSGCEFLKSNECADRDDIFLVPFRITVLQEHEDGEEDIEPELEDLKVRSSHRGCGTRGNKGVLPIIDSSYSPIGPSSKSLLTSSTEGGSNKYSQLIRNAPLAFDPHPPCLSQNTSTQINLSRTQGISVLATLSILSPETIRQTCPMHIVGDTAPLLSQSTRSPLLHVSNVLDRCPSTKPQRRGQTRTLPTGLSTTNCV